MKKLILTLFCIVQFSAFAQVELEQTLDRFHQAAAQAKFDDYFALLADNAVFLGTDSSERWSKSHFAQFVKPYFSKGQGWLYQPIQRTISATPSKDIYFFDELLENKSYGRCRGSGLLIKTAQGWQILQYNLSIPIPNAIAKDLTKQIQTFRKTNE